MKYLVKKPFFVDYGPFLVGPIGIINIIVFIRFNINIKYF